MQTNSLTFTQNRLTKMGIILLILATLDAFFTDMGIQNQLITEANPLMRIIYEVNLLGFYFIKIALPVLLIGIVSRLESRPFIVILLHIAISLYVCVLLLHFSWLAMSFFM